MKFLKKIGSATLVVVALIICVIGLALYLLLVPFDLIRFLLSPYHRELKKKYRLFLTDKQAYKLYNRIKRDKLDNITYEDNDGYEYFLKDGNVILPDWNFSSFQLEDGIWSYGNDEHKESLEEIYTEEREHLKDEHKELSIKFIVFDSDAMSKSDEYKNSPFCFIFFE